MQKPEILAPAGSMESLMAALHCGADAVYAGMQQYSARNHAVNFSLQELKQAAELCHIYHARLYLTVNTLLTDTELPDCIDMVQKAAACGIDACIVQDVGVLQCIHSVIPDMPLHASTQMSIHTAEGAWQAKALGCCRVVAAREMSCEDLKQLCQVSVATEVFVHGALCMSVSGQCSFSAVVGGRSANRGNCAQACRLPWHTPEGRNPAALSLKDLSLVQHVQALQQIGVDAFKIEGRMKRPEYVAAAVTALRMALNGEQPDMHMLQAAFSRSGFTDGYFTGEKKNMFGYRTKQDVLAGQQVYKQIQASCQKPAVVTSLDFDLQLQAGKPARLTVQDTQGHQVVLCGDVPEQAQKMPLHLKSMQKYFSKLGGTVYQAGTMHISNPDNLLLSASQCNALRRSAVEAMHTVRCQAYTPVYAVQPDALPKIEPVQKRKNICQIRLHVRTISQLNAALQTEKIICLPVALAEQSAPSVSIWVESPRIITQESIYQERLTKLYEKGFRHLLCHNLADIRIGQKIGFILHGGFGLNCTNSMTAYVLKKQGLQDMTASYELRSKAIWKLNQSMPCGAIVYGRLPMMLFRICPIRTQDGCRHKNCFLTDRTGRKFLLLCSAQNAYTELYNSEIVYLADKLNHFRSLAYWDFYFTDEKPAQIRQILHAYENKNMQACPENKISGLYFKGGLS